MKFCPNCAIGIYLLLFSGCKDIDETLPKRVTEHPVAPRRVSSPSSINVNPIGRATIDSPGSINVYPMDRTITDSQGRSINSTILGKHGIEIAISKDNGAKKYIIPLERLSKQDQEYFFDFNDGGKFAEIKEKLKQETRLAGRVARWHRDTNSAEREAAKLRLPILVTVLITGNTESQSMEKKLNFSDEFRDWAAKNLVLCMLKVDDPNSKITTSYTAVENRDAAARYGIIEYESPAAFLVNPLEGKQLFLSNVSLSNSKSAIYSITSALEKRHSWSEIIPGVAPKKLRGKVNKGKEDIPSF